MGIMFTHWTNYELIRFMKCLTKCLIINLVIFLALCTTSAIYKL